ncbi:MAG TPA: transcription antitermination factor NusB, partial [Fibrobacteraceae bacterium]|nr:transcription antitermination factor NusB [Fibrobacteraceae bacterium]
MSVASVHVAGLPPRRLAWEALHTWLCDGATVQETLQAKALQLPERDRALAWELALGTCRHYRHLQYAVRHFSHRAPAQPVEIALCLGLYQLQKMQKIPPHAAVHVTVALVRVQSGEAAGRFANAILQRSLREGVPPPPKNDLAKIAIGYSMPDWLVRKWMRDQGDDLEAVRLRCEQARAIPSQWVRIRPARISMEKFLRTFDLLEARIWEDCWVEVGHHLGRLLQSPEFRSGDFSVQNPAAELLVRLLDAQPGQSVWDACAAPGGKTALILERQPQVQLLASDVDSKRLARMQDLRKRLGYIGLHIEVRDATASG